MHDKEKSKIRYNLKTFFKLEGIGYFEVKDFNKYY